MFFLSLQPIHTMNTVNMTSNNPNPEQHDADAFNKINQLELDGDEQEDQEDENLYDGERQYDRTDYSSFSKTDFIKKAQSLIDSTDIKQAHDSFKKMRILFDDIIKTEREQLIQQFVAEGNNPRDFRAPIDEGKTAFYKAYEQLLERRAQLKKQADEEKQKNLKEKQSILEQIKAITEQEETEHSLEELKELQRKWKQVGRIPKEQMHDLWETYRVLLDAFYDKLSMYNELKDLDRQKNLEAKIELTKKVASLLDENSIKKSHILLNKYHEDFKNVGPVPKEFSDDIWTRFKDASDQVIELNKKRIEEIKEKRKHNLDLKEVLCEKMELVSETTAKTPAEWSKKQKEADALFEEWKAIGPVPESMSDQVWKRFRQAQNQYYKNKKEFFNSLNKNREENYKLKLGLCEKAEQWSDSNEFETVSGKLMQLQEEWKTIGPVPEKFSDEVWNRFRAACDSFFKRRDIHRKAQKDEELQNLKLKSALLDQLETLLGQPEKNKEEAFASLRGIQKEWGQIGFIPRNKFAAFRKKYDKLTEEILKQFDLSADEFKKTRFKEHIEMLAEKPNSGGALRNEERKISDRIRVLKNEIDTLNNNLGFFASSKSADQFVKQFQDKIDKNNQLISKLEQDLKVIRSVKKQHG